ncbi:hypothetical protein CJF32_00000788 [Rutstroemia sp. NJR-2017a WRK4]|nr:hypothetical protein CJF32_00000788 [Rutstroemia sp. NJR-2017a WRK4]
MTERNLSWVDIFLCYPIFDKIYSHLDPVDILFLRLTTKKLSPCFESLFKTQWNINRQLTRFVKDPISLRSLLAKHDALISGDDTVQFFKRTIWDDDDDFGLDIFVDTLSPFRKSDPIDEYLIGREGYELQSTKAWSIKKYHRRSSTKAEVAQVRIIYTIGTPLKAIFRIFRRSFVVNIISWNFAYSLFPDLNYIKRTAHSSKGGRNANSEQEAAAQGGIKYLHSLQFNSSRRIGDSYTWSIALDTNSIKAGQPTSVLQHSFFKVMENIRNGDHVVSVESFRSPVLRYQYTVSDKHFYDPRAFWDLIEQKLTELINLELSKIPEDARPAFLGTNRPTFERACELNWTFYDDQVPIWHEQYPIDEAERMRITMK